MNGRKNLQGALDGLGAAIGFLTAVPLRRTGAGPEDIARGAAWFPVIGAVLASVHAVLAPHWPPELPAGLVVAAWAAVTGGLHLEGLADSLDGLLAAVPPERRLEILRDPRRGSLAVAGTALFLILKVLAVAAVPDPNSFHGAMPLLVAPTLARWLVLVAARERPARKEGLAFELGSRLQGRSVLLAAILPVTLGALAGLRGWAALAACLLLTHGVRAAARARLGGITGDLLGLNVECVELTALIVLTWDFPS
jgi:adenosylcobinamide-GDP ribazoletransferase